MLKRFEVENYKNFDKRVVFDFTKVKDYEFNKECIHDNVIGMTMIYGANAVGKTNLGKAIMDITWLIAQVRRIINYDVVNAESEKNPLCFYIILTLERMTSF